MCIPRQRCSQSLFGHPPFDGLQIYTNLGFLLEGIWGRFWNWDCLQHESSGRTWYVTVGSPGRWSDQVRTKGRPCISLLSHFIHSGAIFQGGLKWKRKKKKFPMECWEQPFDYWDLLLRAYCTKKIFTSFYEQYLWKKSQNLIYVWGKIMYEKKPSMHTSLKQAKGKLLLTSTLIF